MISRSSPVSGLIPADSTWYLISKMPFYSPWLQTWFKPL